MAPPATLLSAVPVPFEINGDLDVKGQETLLRHLLKDAGVPGVFVADRPTRVTLDESTPAQLETLRTAVQELT